MPPITPDEVVEHKKKILPEEVFEVFNDHIARNWDGFSSRFLLKDVSVEIVNRLNITYQKAIGDKLFDVEEVYRKAGWKVQYDRPAYNESYDSFYIFRRKCPAKKSYQTVFAR